MLTFKYDRHEVVLELIKSGAKVDTRDAQGRFALYHAARTGNDQAVAMILKRKPLTNDGSLHEASRKFHPQVVQRLIAAKHDPNFRSTKHGGRTPLGELALHGAIVTSTDYSSAEDTVEILKDSHADPLLKCRGKTVIFLALDNNVNPLPIAQVLIERLLWNTINDTANIVQVGDYLYSPSMYISKGLMRGIISQQRHLMQLLDEQGCTDVFHAPFGETQPEDAHGMPKDIADFEKVRRERERVVAAEREDHDNQLRRELQRAQQEDFLAQSRNEREFSNRKQGDDYGRENLFLNTDLRLQIARADMNNQIHIQENRLGFEQQEHRQNMEQLQDQRDANLQHEKLIHKRQLTKEMETGQMKLALGRESAASRFHAQHDVEMGALSVLERRNHIEREDQRSRDHQSFKQQHRFNQLDRRHELARARIGLYARDQEGLQDVYHSQRRHNMDVHHRTGGQRRLLH